MKFDNYITSSNKIAFTLAEILITLTIIGVIAALTIPTLLNKYNEKKTISQLNKMYSTLSQALASAQREYGINPDDWPDDYKDSNPANKVVTGMKKYLYNTKDQMSWAQKDYKERCMEGNKNYCNWKDLKGGTVETAIVTSLPHGMRGLALEDQSLISFIHNWVYAWSPPGYTNINYVILVDLDGAKQGPNVFGKDSFAFIFNPEYKNGQLLPYGMPPLSYNPKACGASKTSHVYTNGAGCTHWVLTRKNMDYLKKDITNEY